MVKTTINKEKHLTFRIDYSKKNTDFSDFKGHYVEKHLTGSNMKRFVKRKIKNFL